MTSMRAELLVLKLGVERAHGRRRPTPTAPRTHRRIRFSVRDALDLASRQYAISKCSQRMAYAVTRIRARSLDSCGPVLRLSLASARWAQSRCHSSP